MSKKILICDDDEGVSEMMRAMLESEAYVVEVLSSGKAIQKKVKQFDPSLIFIDIWMPGIDGKESIKLLKKDPQTKSIPIIVISALHENELSQIVKKIEVEGFLPKPFDMINLLEIVAKYAKE